MRLAVDTGERAFVWGREGDREAKMRTHHYPGIPGAPCSRLQRAGRVAGVSILDVHPKRVCTPNSVCPARAGEAAIYLGARSLVPSSSLPGAGRLPVGSRVSLPRPLEAGRFIRRPIWPCSAWGLHCRTGCPLRGELLPHHFTLTPIPGKPDDRGGILSVALSVASPVCLRKSDWAPSR